MTSPSKLKRVAKIFSSTAFKDLGFSACVKMYFACLGSMESTLSMSLSYMLMGMNYTVENVMNKVK
jgi:hypothetical protein